MHTHSEQYINAAPTCFNAVHAPPSGSSQFLMKYVYANVMGAKIEIK
jgi:hypothetical protein